MKFLSKKILFFSIVSLFISCKTVKVETVFMQKYIPGVPSGTSGVKYGFQLTTTTMAVLDRISFINQDFEIQDYSIIRIPDGKMFEKNASLEKGVYHVDFFVKDKETNNLPQEESIKINYSVANKKRTLTKKVRLKSSFKSK